MGKEDNTLKALKKYWISAVRALVRLNVSLLFHFLSLFSQSVCPRVSIPWRNVRGGGIWKEIKRPLCQCAYMNRFTSFMTPHPSPPTACSLSLCLSQSFYLSLSPPSPSLPQNSILYLLVMERSSAVLCQAQYNILDCRSGEHQRCVFNLKIWADVPPDFHYSLSFQLLINAM